ncbi:MAG: response regulator transcription factor [Planctomycetes bacterium]|nr:response regulator transcription factor [Planctomycetota bacterium]
MSTDKGQDKNDKNKSRIVIVDDHPIVREGLSDLINKEDDLAVCGEAEDGQGAMAVIKELEPDIAIVDISLQETSGLELIKDLKVQHPSMPVLALSMYEESLYAERVLRAGAKGYIMKREATKNVVMAIRKVLSGQLYLSEKMAITLVDKLVGGKADASSSPIDRLTDRELEVFSMLGHGKGTRQISERLHLSVKTIETYRSRIKEKLNLASGSELLQHAFQWINNRGKG